MIGLAVLFVVAAAAALAAPSFVDWNRYRAEISSRVERVLGVPVEISGDIDFTLLPTPALSVRDVRVLDPDGAESALASLGALDVQLAFGPLLRGDFELRDVVLQDPRLNIELDAEGNLNWRFGGGGGGGGDAPPAADAGPDVTIDRFRVRGGAVTVRDAGRDLTVVIADINAEISADALNGPYQANGEFLWAGVPMAFTAAVGAMGIGRPAGLRLDLSLRDQADHLLFRGTHSVTDGVWAVRGDATLEGDDFAATAHVLAEALAIAPPAMRGMAVPYQFTTGLAASATAAAATNIELRLADIGASGGVRVMFGDVLRFESELAVTQIDFDALLARADNERRPFQESLDRGMAFAIPANVEGTLAVTVEATTFRGRLVRGAEFAAELGDGTVRVSAFHAELPGITDISGNGVLTAADGAPQFDGELALRSDNARELLAWLGIDPVAVPPDRLNSLSYAGRLRMGPDLIQAYGFEARVDTTGFRGAVGVALRERPAFSIDAVIDRLNLDSYRLFAPPSPDAAPAPFELSVLDRFDTDIRLRADEITWRGVRAEGLWIDLGLLGGVLTMREITVAGLAGARGTLTGIANGFSSTVAGTGTINVAAADASGLARLAGFPPGIAPERMGEFMFNARLDGDQSNLAVDMGALLGGAQLRLQGAVRDLGPEPQLDLAFAATHADLAELLELFGLGGASPGDDGGEVDLRGFVEGDLGALAVGLSGEMAGATVGLSGEVAARDNPSWDVQFQVRHADASAWLARLGVPYRAARPLGEISVRMAVDGEPERIRVRGLDAVVAGTEFAGEGELRLDGPRPSLVADLIAGDIDLDGILPAPPAQSGRPARREWSGQPIPFDALTEMDLDISFAAGSVRVMGLDLEVPNVSARLADGHLVLSPVHAGLYGGKLNADAEVVAGDVPRVAVRAELVDGELAQAPRIPWAFSPISGTARVVARFEAVGESERELVSSVDGTLLVEASGGRFAGLRITGLGASVESLADVADLQELLQQSVAGGETAFATFDGEATINDGIVTLETLTADLEGASLTGRGTVELARRRSDLDFTVVLVDRPSMPPFALEVAGPWDAPRKSVRSRDLQAWVTRRIGEAVLRELAPGLPDAAGGLGAALDAVVPDG
ncbi:MAG: AsmA family protein, partial [Proteobacteria bacterium]|nr:AsmA family protein [Pseudomonadota bacterium]